MPNGQFKLCICTLPRVTSLAEIHLRYAPVEVMRAERGQLLRIPGIGPVGADAIIKARRQGNLTDLADLQKLGIRAPEQAAPYIWHSEKE